MHPSSDRNAVLVLGGARSGKSRYARALAEASGRTPIFIATATPGDAEMAERIARHKAERAARWRLVEEQLALVETLLRETASDRIVLVDCVSFWLANLMFEGRDLAAETERLAVAVEGLVGPAIFVANEVGFGIVPQTAMGRSFRDAQGWLNQRLAQACRHVVLIAAGLPLVLKPRPEPDIQL
ncbi:MAG TPA: bifunctional adenosylcobinamide kinase/adenosylcobinamide-phosphate guanylyltransferase [Beijerinckiaceae bacterium]|jgi:adenosylcobinamide kinase/adenosylcobinamide-phosphate guanylyltransferase|nr:bifunctional adenosylcobinamide kinase/adenosylcobinamide-phosphate guanylyltransferase [Beijerinckiaceae bacterium]